MEEQQADPIRFEFSLSQKTAVENSLIVIATSEKYVQQLAEKSLEITKKISRLEKELSQSKNELELAQKEILKTENYARKNYEDTLRNVVSEFETPPPPWKAILIKDRDVPIGVNLVREQLKSRAPGP